MNIFNMPKIKMILLSVLFIVMSVIIYQASLSTAGKIVIGQHDSVWIRAFDEVDTSDNQTFRWSSDKSIIRIPLIHQGWNTATLYGWGSQSGTRSTNQSADVTSSIEYHTAIPFTVQSAFRRHYTLLVPPPALPFWYTPLTLQSSVVSDTVNSRYLGMAIMWVAVQPTIIHTGIPYSLLVFWGLCLICGLFCKLLGVSWRTSVISGICIMSVIAVAYITHPIALLPHLHWVALWVGLCCGGIVIARMTRIILDGTHVPGFALPLLCALAFWLLPLYQIFLRLDDVYIRNFRFESWMGIVLGLIIIGGISLTLLQNRRLIPYIPNLAYWYMLTGFAALGIGYQLSMGNHLFTYGSGDFVIWLNAARRWVDSGVLYDTSKIADNPFAVYKRPPFYIMLFTPFVRFDELLVLQYFRVANIILFLITLGIWVRMMQRQYLWWGLVLIFLTNYQPLYDTLAYGQTDIILLFCFTLVLWAIHTQRPEWAGIVVAFLTMIKIYPVLLLAFFVIKRQWKGVIGFVIGMIIWNLIAIMVIGWDIHVQYVTRILPSIGGTTSWIENQTIAGFITRWYDNPFAMSRFSFHSVERIATLISGGLSALVCLLAFRDTPIRDSRFAVQYAMFVMLMVIAIPVAWMHYSTLLILVFLIMFWHYQTKIVNIVPAVLFAMSYALIAFGNFRSFNYPTNLGIVSILMSSYKFYGMILLLIVLFYEVWQSTTRWNQDWFHDLHTIWHRIRRQPSQKNKTEHELILHD